MLLTKKLPLQNSLEFKWRVVHYRVTVMVALYFFNMCDRGDGIMSTKDGERAGFSQEDWLELCQYVEKNVMSYDENLKAPRELYLRLRGLSRGQFMANNFANKQAEYSYKIILLTFKYCSLNIKRAVATKHFKSEQNKLNYIMVIIERNINDVYFKIKANEEASKKAEVLNMEDNYAPQHYYKAKDNSVKKGNTLLEDDIW